jgi:murein L,D-transpeptidase YcbB/YkuD
MYTSKVNYRFFNALISIFCLSFLFSCSSKKDGKGGGISNVFSSDYYDAEAFALLAKNQYAALDMADTAIKSKLVSDPDLSLNMRLTYQLSQYQPLWFNQDGLLKDAAQLQQWLVSMADDGLNLDSSRMKTVNYILSKAQSKDSPSTDTLLYWDAYLCQTWLQAGQKLLMGATNMKQVDQDWFANNDTAFYGPQVLWATVGHISARNLDTFRSTIPLYQQVKTALKHWQELAADTQYNAAKKQIQFGILDSNVLLGNTEPRSNDSLTHNQAWLATYQYMHQLRNTTKMDSVTTAALKQTPQAYISQLQLSLERLRALPRVIGAEHVWVTIPLMEVDYSKDKQSLFHSRVVIGKPSRATPTLWAPMTNVLFNPPWGVPPTILKNDVGPGVSRSGPAYLARKGLRAYDAKGNDVTSSVNGSNYKRFAYRQPPGAGNSLGEIKFNLPNKWDIYLHDTPHRENFANRQRALSSGCVRVQNPKILAELLLEDKQYTPEKIDSVISTRKTKLVKIDRNLPVYIVYLTHAMDSTGQHMRYLNDVYKRDAAILAQKSVLQ